MLRHLPGSNSITLSMSINRIMAAIVAIRQEFPSIFLVFSHLEIT